MNKQLRIKITFAAVFAVVIIAALLLVRSKAVKENLTQYSPLAANDGFVDIVLDNEKYAGYGLYREGIVYVPTELIKELDGSFYDDEDDNDRTITYVLPTEIIRFVPDETAYLSNGTLTEHESKYLISDNGKYYLDLDFFGPKCGIDYMFSDCPERLVFRNKIQDYLFYDTTEQTPLHTEASLSSSLIGYLPEGTKLYYIAGFGNERNSLIKVMTLDGTYGFVKKSYLSESYYDTLYPTASYEPEQNHLLYDKGPIKLGWFYTSGRSGNSTYSECKQIAHGMNIISPTWFNLSDNEGGLDAGAADKAWVTKAHNDGLQVWILATFTDGEVSPHAVLSRNVSRGILIDNLINECLKVGADGINIDFEGLSVKTGPHYVEFIKELSVRCHSEGLILSTCNMLPGTGWGHYDIETCAKYADYIILMAYDEHYAKSSEAGSVASIDFVRKGILNTLPLCESERIITGIPFYTRLWKSDAGQLSSEALSIYSAQQYVKKNRITLNWDKTTCQNYAEFSIDGADYKLWMEDASSIYCKCVVARDYGTAGVACWRLNYETREIWDTINSCFE